VERLPRDATFRILTAPAVLGSAAMSNLIRSKATKHFLAGENRVRHFCVHLVTVLDLLQQLEITRVGLATTANQTAPCLSRRSLPFRCYDLSRQKARVYNELSSGYKPGFIGREV
jgi:hypothetical protein